MKTPEKAGRKQAAAGNRGQWQAGVSGNPAGRKPGTGEIARLRQGIAKDIPAILKAMIAKAIDGDAGAARLVLERVLPPLRPVELAVSLALPADAGLTQQGQAIVSAVAAGQLSPSQGAAMLGGLAGLARVREVDELAARVAALEAGSNGDS